MSKPVMAWIDELACVAATDFQARRNHIAQLFVEADELSRKAQTLRAKGYVLAAVLEGDAKEVWTREDIDRAKERVPCR